MTAINGNPRLVRPPQNTTHTPVRRTSHTPPSRRRALAVTVTAALLAGVCIAIDAATTTASAITPAPPGTSSRPVGTSATHLPDPLLGPTGFAPGPLSQGSNI